MAMWKTLDEDIFEPEEFEDEEDTSSKKNTRPRRRPRDEFCPGPAKAAWFTFLRWTLGTVVVLIFLLCWFLNRDD